MDTTSSFIELIKNYWDAILALIFIGGMIQKFRYQGSDIEDMQERMVNLETKNNEQEIQIALFDERLSRIPRIEEKLDKALGID